MPNTKYTKPKDLHDLLYIKEKKENRGEIIAGGTNLIPQLNGGIKAPEYLIDISDLEELAYIREENGSITIGAGAKIADIASSETIKLKSPILASAMSQIGNPLTRNRATLGGNLANASPAADAAPPLLALEAYLNLESIGKEARTVPLDGYFVGPNKTVLKDYEIITSISFKKPKSPFNSCYIKLGLRNAMAISVVSIAVMLNIEESICIKARIALGSVAPKPVRAHSAEKILEGRALSQNAIESSALALIKEISPISDIRASAEYRRHAASVLLKRAIQNAQIGGKK